MIILICAVAVLGFVDLKRKSISLFALLGMLAFCVVWNLVSREMSPVNMLIGAVPSGVMFLAVKLTKLNMGAGYPAYGGAWGCAWSGYGMHYSACGFHYLCRGERSTAGG